MLAEPCIFRWMYIAQSFWVLDLVSYRLIGVSKLAGISNVWQKSLQLYCCFTDLYMSRSDLVFANFERHFFVW